MTAQDQTRPRKSDADLAETWRLRDNAGPRGQGTQQMSAWTSFIHTFSRRFRGNRDQLITTTFPNFSELRVCDLGGSRHFWERWPAEKVPKNLVVLNIGTDGASESHTGTLKDMAIELYDGKRIPYPDGHFDVLICNSVIEHVAPELRQPIVDEIKRVSRYHFVQTPAYEFPIEPHFVLPFMHWLPRGLAARLVPVSPWALLSRPSRAYMTTYFEEIRLLTYDEVRAYFPKSQIWLEKFCGCTKSYTAHGPS
jgi:hypothetical protein